MAKTVSLAPSTTATEFLKIPDDHREKIVVFDDDKLAEAQQATKSDPINLNSTDYTELASLGWGVGGPIGAAVGFGIGAAIEEVSHLLQKGPMPYVLISRSACAKAQFPVDHPKNKVVYVRHPFVSTLYYPMAEFHHYLFLHKHLEAVRLLKTLGAIHVEVEYEAGWSQTEMGKLSLPVVTTGVDISAKAASKRESSAMVLYSATYNPPRTRSIPKDLVWYPREDEWKSIADEVLNYRLTEFTLTVENKDSYGIDASAKAEVAKFGFELGGEFQDYQDTKWTIKADFPARRKRSPQTPK